MFTHGKKTISLFIFAMLVLSCTIPLAVHGQGVPGFSGYPAYIPIPCVCSVSLWSFFAPLWLSIVPIVGPVVYVPYATVPYPYFTPTAPATSHVGAYIPLVQACWVYVGLACVVLPSVGVMMWVGTGVPGASL